MSGISTRTAYVIARTIVKDTGRVSRDFIEPHPTRSYETEGQNGGILRQIPNLCEGSKVASSHRTLVWDWLGWATTCEIG
jgi:hypothetical protein